MLLGTGTAMGAGRRPGVGERGRHTVVHWKMLGACSTGAATAASCDRRHAWLLSLRALSPRWFAATQRAARCCAALHPVLPGLTRALQAGVQQLQTAVCFAWQRPARWLVVGNSCDSQLMVGWHTQTPSLCRHQPGRGGVTHVTCMTLTVACDPSTTVLHLAGG